ncbi:hypothetical protein U1Q18_016285 [Sarracenia purpurea var. burkii]
MDLNGLLFVEEDFLVKIITKADILTREEEEEKVFTIMLVKYVIEPTTLLWIAIIDWILNIDNNPRLTIKFKEIKVKEISSLKHCLLPIQCLNQNKCPGNSTPEFKAPQNLPLWWTTSVTQPTPASAPSSAPDSAPLLPSPSNLTTSFTSSTTPFQSSYLVSATVPLIEPAPELIGAVNSSHFTAPIHSPQSNPATYSFPQSANAHPMVTRAKAAYLSN